MKRGIAVLALQGDFAAHGRRLGQMGLDSFEARKPEELEGASGLVVPGGESTTLWKFFESAPWEDAIRRFAATGANRSTFKRGCTAGRVGTWPATRCSDFASSPASIS